MASSLSVFSTVRLAAVFLLAVVGAHAERTWVPGLTEPLQDALLSASSAGTVVKINYKEGDRIEKGAAILELDRALEELESERRRSVYESRAELAAAEQRAEVLKADYESTKRLFDKSQSVSRDELDKKRLEAALAEAERDRLASTKDREKLEYDMAREQLARRYVVAPFSGVVTDVRVDLGEACEPRQPVVRLVDLAQGRFIANLTPAQSTRFAVGRPVELEFDAEGGPFVLKGEVEFLSPVVDASSGLRRIKVSFANTDSRIAPGVVARIAVD